MNRPYAGSYECGRRLVAAGCPLDFLNSLPRIPPKPRKTFSVYRLRGYSGSVIYDVGHAQTVFVLALAIRSEVRCGVVIVDWAFDPPWRDYHIDWDYQAGDTVPERDLPVYGKLLCSRLPDVLNDHLLIARGRPVQGLLCGRGFSAIPDSIAPGEPVRAKLRITDDCGSTETLHLALPIDRSLAPKKQERAVPRVAPLFDCPDLAGSGRDRSAVRSAR
jgi:hypothetical protein